MKKKYTKLFYTVTLIAGLLLSASPSRAAEIFVSSTGDDWSGDGSIGNPYQTIQRACNFVAAGDIIYLRGGTYTYRDYIDTDVDGTATQPITIKNYNNETVVYDGASVSMSTNKAMITFATWDGDEWLSYYILEGITVKNSVERGISFYKTDHLTIRNCIVHDIETRAIGGYGKFITIDNNEIYNAVLENENGVMGGSGWAMTCYTTTDYDNGDPSEHVTISNNYIHNCWGEGIGPGQGSDDVLIENNEVRDVWSVGIYADKATNVVVRNNHIYMADPTYYRNGKPAIGISMANEISFISWEGPAIYSPISNFSIYNNLIINTRKGIGFWWDDSNTEPQNSYDNIIIAYNVIYNPVDYGIAIDEIPAGYDAPYGCILKNNIIYDGTLGSYIDDASTAWDIANNDWVDGVPSFGSMSCFSGNPNFTSPGNAAPPTGFQLSAATSACYQTGTPVPTITTEDFWGTARSATTPSVGIHEAAFAGTPTITTSVTTLPAFPITNIGSNSASQSFTASGTDLTDDITVTAPAEFEVSLTEVGGYGNSVTLSPTGGTVANTTIYARFSPTSAGNKTGNIILSSTGAADVNVAVSGEAIFIPPTPTITTSTNALTAFPNTNINGHSTAQNFTVSGTDIISGIGISAPTHFEISITEGTGYSNTLYLPASGGTVPNTTIYARFSPTVTGLKAGTIELGSTGATSKYITVSGVAFPAANLNFNCSSMRPAAASVGNSGKAMALPVYGSNLYHDVIVTGSTNFEVSLAETSGFGNQVTLTPAGDGTLNTDIYVRYTPQTVGDHHEYIEGWYNEAPGGLSDCQVTVDSYGFAGGTTVCNWFGSVNSDWSAPLNWDNMTVPPTSASVFIMADENCNTSGDFPTINPAIEASVAEIRSPAAYPATLTLASDATGTGSLIVTNSTSYTNFVVNRYLPGAAQSWHMVGAPLNNVAIGSSNFNPGGNDDLYAWHEPSPGTWVNFKNQDGSGGIPSFPGANGDNNFHPGKGYLVAYDALNPVKQFSGQNLVTGNVGFTLSRAAKKDWTYNSGWNLLANPYTSGIDWNLADRSKFEDNYAYVYDPNKSGGEGYTSVNGGVADAFIGIGQGFMVLAKATSDGQVFNFTPAMQKHGGDFMKAPANNNGLTLRLASLSYYNETSILLDEAAEFNRDRNDALKLFSFNPEIPQLYSFSADGAQLDINSIPSIDGQTTVDLGLKVGREDSYEISLTEQTGSMTQVIYLEDKLTGEMHNLTQHSYSFAAAEGQIDDRFTLHFGVTGIAKPEMENMNIYCANSTLYIQGETGPATLEMFDITGKRLSSKQVMIDGTYTESLSLNTGMYLVRVTSHNQSNTTKVFVK